MFLNAEYYYGGQYREPNEHNAEEGHTLHITGEFVDKNKLSAGKVAMITEEVISWRKANQIHGWFMRNVAQDDIGEGIGPFYVRRKDLVRLLEDCKETLCALDAEDYDKAEEILPPMQGCFFGQYDVKHSWYKQDIVDTIDQLVNLLSEDKDCSYYYSSSW